MTLSPESASGGGVPDVGESRTPSPGQGGRTRGKGRGKEKEVIPLKVDRPQPYAKETKVVMKTEHARTFDVGLDASA